MTRPLLKVLHTWVGITTGSFLAVIGLTGSVIVFRAEIERAALAPLVRTIGPSQKTSLDEAAREIHRVQPEAQVRRVRLPAAPGDPYVFQIETSTGQTVRLVSDPSSGRVLGAIEPGWVEWTIDLHRNLLAGKTGRKAVGVAGIALFVLSMSGMLMWSTGTRNWRAWISVRNDGTARRFHFTLHRASGLWAYGLLAVLSFTGIGLAFPDTYRQAMQSLTGVASPERPPKGGKATALRSLDEYLLAGKRAMPDGTATELRLPASGKGLVDLHLRRTGDLPPAGNHVYLDSATAKVVRVDRVADKPAPARFLASLSPVHYAQFGGMPIKIVWALVGVTPTLLFVTGLIAWWRPARKRTDREIEKKEPVFAAR